MTLPMPMMLRITAARAAPASLACESVCATSALRVRPQGCVLHSLAHGSAPSAARSRLMQCPLHSPARPHQPQARCGAPGRHAHYATAAAAATAPAVSPHVPIWAVAREQSSAAAAAEPPGRSASADDLGARAQPHSAEAEGPGRAPAEVPPRAEDSPTTITISPSTDSGRRKGGTQLAPRKAADLTTKKPPAAPPLVNDDGMFVPLSHCSLGLAVLCLGHTVWSVSRSVSLSHMYGWSRALCRCPAAWNGCRHGDLASANGGERQRVTLHETVPLHLVDADIN